MELKLFANEVSKEFFFAELLRNNLNCSFIKNYFDWEMIKNFSNIVFKLIGLKITKFKISILIIPNNWWLLLINIWSISFILILFHDKSYLLNPVTIVNKLNKIKILTNHYLQSTCSILKQSFRMSSISSRIHFLQRGQYLVRLYDTSYANSVWILN